MLRATSLANAAISTASTPSEISSPAPMPTIPMPSTRSVFGSTMSLVMPSVRSRVRARPEAAQGNFAILTVASFFLRLGFGQAAPGDFGIGEDDGWNGVRFEGDLVSGNGFDRGASFVRGLVRQHRFADHVADGINRWVVGLELLVDLNKSALARP